MEIGYLKKKKDDKVKMESGVLCVNNWCNTYMVCVQVEQVIPLPSLEEVTTYEALPSVAHPSDHIALVCDLRWNPWPLTSNHDGQRCLKTQSVRFKLCPCRFTKKNQSQQTAQRIRQKNLNHKTTTQWKFMWNYSQSLLDNKLFSSLIFSVGMRKVSNCRFWEGI